MRVHLRRKSEALTKYTWFVLSGFAKTSLYVNMSVREHSARERAGLFSSLWCDW